MTEKLSKAQKAVLRVQQLNRLVYDLWKAGKKAGLHNYTLEEAIKMSKGK